MSVDFDSRFGGRRGSEIKSDLSVADELEHSVREAFVKEVLHESYGSAVLAGAVLIPFIAVDHAAIVLFPDVMISFFLHLFTAFAQIFYNVCVLCKRDLILCQRNIFTVTAHLNSSFYFL